MTMEWLINAFCKTSYPITDAPGVLQHVLRHLSLGRRISLLIVDKINVTGTGKPH